MDIKKDIQGGTSPVRGREGSHRFHASNGMESFTISLSKKCERLATALYLVTSFLSDTEPLKSRLRTLSLELVRDASCVRYSMTSVETNVLEELRANIGETLGLLELALIAGLVSEMNFSILKREYATLRDAIEIKKASRESRTDAILGDTFFGSSFQNSPADLLGGAQSRSGNPDIEGRAKASPAGTDDNKGHSIGQKEIMMSDMNHRVRDNEKKMPTSTEPTKTYKGHIASSISAPRTFVDVAKESRRTRILKLVKDNREVTIKDIATYFPELSEKTIQRELVSLTGEGVLKKSGERRWSRYALA